jgi:hypothetical protein
MAQMKGVEEFIWVLAIALVLVAAFVAITALFPYNPAAPVANNTAAENASGAIASFSQVGFVGYSSSYAGQNIDYGYFTVGQSQSLNMGRAIELDMCAGLWCNRQHEMQADVPAYYMDTMRNVKIGFAIYDTNQYGDLVVRWNGKEFYRGRASARDYTIYIDKQYVKESNTLQIYAEGPGLMFWASTIYSIRDFSADLEYGPSTIKAFTLSQAELNAWNSGDLSFFTQVHTSGQLRVRMNGNVVYQGPAGGTQSIALNYSNAGPRVGENILTFEGMNNGVFTLTNVQLRLYIMTNQITKTKTFALKASDYSRLATGNITFYVNSVQREGSMTMKLNGKYLSVPRPAAGENIVFFTKTEAAQGTNTLEISGDGYWDLGDMKVEI